MVLLSFFILFFTVDKTDKDALVNIISQVKERGLGQGDGSGFKSNPTSIAPAKSPAQIINDIKIDIKGVSVTSNEKSKTVVLTLPDNIYSTGKISPSAEGAKMLQSLLALLKPFSQDIDLIFVGHTDSIPVTKKRAQFLENNFDLSALRAASAIKIALMAGMPQARVFMHGAADNTRNTKSLSIIVKPKGHGGV
jgi:flagellar motor protein MotB